MHQHQPMKLSIKPEDPATSDILQLLEAHLAFAASVSPREAMHALDVEALRVPEVTFWAARSDGALAGVGALKELDSRHGEIKSMHTSEAMRSKGIARQIVGAILDEARRRGYERLSLETGPPPAFAAAHALYVREGFGPCGPFAGYEEHPHSCFMTMLLEAK